MQDESTGTEIKEERREKEMSNTTQTLAVIKKTNTEVTELQERLELVYKDLSRIGGSTSGFAKVSQAVRQTSSQTEVAVIQLNSLNKEMEQATEKTEEYKDTFQGMGEALPTVGNLCEKVWTSIGNVCKSLWNSMGTACEKLGDSMENTMETLEAFNYYKDTLGSIANEWSGDYEKYGYENAEAYASSFTDRMNGTIAQLSGMEFDDKNLRLTSSGVKNLGLNYQEVTKYAAQFASVANSVGLSGENTLAASSAFSKLAGDLSSLYNVDYSTISEELERGFVGQADALKKYGIELTDAILQEKAYEMGMKKTVAEMTEAEKTQLRMISIIEQSEAAWGSLANGINQPSNQIRMFQNTISELQELLGQLFLPAFEKIMPYVNGIAIAIKKVLSNIAGIFGIELEYDAQLPDESVASGQSKSTEAIPVTGDAANGLLDVINVYENSWKEAYERMEGKAQTFAETVVGLFAPIEQLFSHIKIGEWFAVGEDVSAIAIGIFDFFYNAINSVDWDLIGNEIGDFLSGIEWDKVFEKGLLLTFEVGDKIAEVWFGIFETAPIESAIVTALAGAEFLGLGKCIGDAMITALGLQGVTFALPLVITITSLAFAYKTGEEKEELKKNIGELGEEGRIVSGTGIMDKAALYQYDVESTNMAISQAGIDAFVEQMESISNFFSEWGEDIRMSIQKVLDTLTELFSVETWQATGEQLKTWFQEDILVPFIQFFTEWGEDIQIGVDKCWESLKSLFSPETWQEVWEQLKNWFNDTIKPMLSKETWLEMLSGMMEALPEPIQNAIKSAIEMLNSFIDTVNKFLKIEWDAFFFRGKKVFDGGSFQLLTIPNIPSFSVGGFPEDGLFFANHGELVGQFSNGKTAVANNEQIVSGIKIGVKEAVSEELAPYLVDIVNNTRETANKDFSTYIGDKEIARASERGRRSMGLKIVTDF